MITAKQYDNILILKDKNNTITLQEANNFRISFEITLKKSFPFVGFCNILGYYSGYDFNKNQSIYCGTMNEKTTVDQIKEYIKKEYNKNDEGSNI